MFSIFIEFMVLLVVGFYSCVGLVNCLLFWLNPTSPFTVCSVLPSDCSLATYFFLCILHPVLLVVFAYSAFTVMCSGMVLYAFIVIPFIVMEFRVDRKSYFALDKLRTLPLLLKEWRIVQIFIIHVNAYLGPGMIPAHSLFTKLSVVSLYMVIRGDQGMSYTTRLMFKLWAFMCTVFWGTALLLGGIVYLDGQKIFKSWKYNKWTGVSKLDKKIMSKFRKSCYPLSMAYGRTYVIKRLAVLKFVRQLSVGLLRALLALHK